MKVKSKEPKVNEKKKAQDEKFSKAFKELKKATKWSDKKTAQFIGNLASVSAEAVLETL